MPPSRSGERGPISPHDWRCRAASCHSGGSQFGFIEHTHKKKVLQSPQMRAYSRVSGRGFSLNRKTRGYALFLCTLLFTATLQPSCFKQMWILNYFVLSLTSGLKVPYYAEFISPIFSDSNKCLQAVNELRKMN